MKRTRVILVAVASLLLCGGVVNAQNTITAASPAEQAKIKPLIDAETSAREKLNAKIATLPSAKAVRDAKEAYDKALEALNKEAEKLPENNEWKKAGAAVLDAAYALQAEHKLSSREWKPQLNSRGELEFAKIEPPKP